MKFKEGYFIMDNDFLKDMDYKDVIKVAKGSLLFFSGMAVGYGITKIIYSLKTTPTRDNTTHSSSEDNSVVYYNNSDDEYVVIDDK